MNSSTRDAVKRFERLEKERAATKEKLDQLTGGYQAIRDTLQQDHGCSSVKEARALLKKLESENNDLLREVDTLLQEIEESTAGSPDEEG